ncbi:MAG: hypothetical protein GY694_00050, partial [Gammaproteobacteria bacterium]|nr:hypothetical protein [Gammaproteobacteria bacterium]
MTSLNLNKTLPLILIPMFCLFIYQATRNSLASVQLNNAHYFLEQQTQQWFNQRQNRTEKHLLAKTQKALSTVRNLVPQNPDYNNLMANLIIWGAFIEPKKTHSLEQAQKHYLLALEVQPNNPYLWAGLAKTSRSSQTKIDALNAMKQASHYAPTERAILKQAVFWKLPIWNQLTSQQQDELIKQLTTLVTNK